MNVIYISVCDVASAIGRNPYNLPETIARKILLRHGIDENKTLTNLEQVLNDILPRDEIVQVAKSKMDGCEITEQVAQISSKMQEQVLDIVQKEVMKKEDNVVKQILTELPRLISGKISQTTGILSESKIIDKVEKETKIEVKNRNCVMKYLDIGIPGTKHIIRIGGKPDGTQLDPVSKKIVIVEVKNRQNKLFDKIPPYEQVAITLYMRLWKSDSCQFIQNFRGETKQELVKFSARKYKNIETALVEFCKKHVLSKLYLVLG